MNRALKRYGYNQDPWDFSGHDTIYRSRCLWTVRNYGQEGNQSTYYPMYEWNIWNHGSKSTVLLQVL